MHGNVHGFESITIRTTLADGDNHDANGFGLGGQTPSALQNHGGQATPPD